MESKNNRPSISNKETARLRFSHLRTAWTSSDIYKATLLVPEPSSTRSDRDEVNLKIQLPFITVAETPDEIQKQLALMILMGHSFCLLSSVCATVLIYTTQKDWFNYAYFPAFIVWWTAAFFIPYTTIDSISWLSLLTTAIFYQPLQAHPALAFLPVASFPLYVFAGRLLKGERVRRARIQQEIKEEHKRLQLNVDQSTQAYEEHQRSFMNTISQEIQDVALMVITTLEQFAPSSILQNTHELLTACSLAIPTTSVFAINTTIRQVCHLSAHLPLLSHLVWRANAQWSEKALPPMNNVEFDIGELLQNMGDAMAGVAAKLDVDFVVYHCNNNLHHMMVMGDEGAIRHALLSHLRNMLECCTPGACIEVGLNVREKTDGVLMVIVHIIHTTSPAIPTAGVTVLPNANLTAQLLCYIRATSSVETKKNQTRFKFSFELESGKEENRKMFINKDTLLLKNHYANIKFSNEPSLKELGQFISQLKGLKMVLHAPEHSIFAKHLTSCLASWNTDISHVPIVSRPQFMDDSDPSQTPESHTPSTPRVVPGPTTPPVPSPAIEEEHLHSLPPAFILIDDDINTLEGKLNEFRAQPAASAHMLHGKRHHPKKSPHQNFFHQGTTAIVHFTTLTNYKAVRDTIQCFTFLPNRDPFSMPRVVVVPKPAGPRRFLTALHTAMNNAVVEPHFSAIATSPSSPVPPMVSLLVQRELASTSPGRVSPDVSPGRRRPLSGLFSPNEQYFGRRKSNDQAPMDYLTAKSPALVAASPREEVPAVEKAVDEPTPKKIKTLSNFKLHKKKRKEKRNLFGNAESPPINVLIVEDNIINQAILSTWMKKHQIKFSVASNGQEAVNKWKSGTFHLILMDIQLPVMSGIDATQKIRSIEKEQKIGVLPAPYAAQPVLEKSPSTFRSPVIIVALTASSLESDRHAALAAGCNDFLTKPVSLEWLEKKIVEWGCMQALIDFEGWRRWKKSADPKRTPPKPTPPLPASEAVEAEKKRIEALCRMPQRTGVMLPGVGNLVKTRKKTELVLHKPS
ncbi:hypothetical protein BY458DRAFT_490073 [Sporodiniella umbellata]|nr:hypothetical protein BY458DRAFT_490073 [Sporodiniella umbellata]